MISLKTTHYHTGVVLGVGFRTGFVTIQDTLLQQTAQLQAVVGNSGAADWTAEEFFCKKRGRPHTASWDPQGPSWLSCLDNTQSANDFRLFSQPWGLQAATLEYLPASSRRFKPFIMYNQQTMI